MVVDRRMGLEPDPVEQADVDAAAAAADVDAAAAVDNDPLGLRSRHEMEDLGPGNWFHYQRKQLCHSAVWQALLD